jgi:two-component system phosphate regulon response regulator PhoB
MAAAAASAATPLVLVVEDEPAQREVLVYNLEAEGFRIAKAATGDEALLLTAELAPDLIVLDWMLPGVSGIEVCRRLKTRDETRGIPVVMLSARSEEVDLVRGLETGADDYVVKPYSVVELMARIRAQLRRTRPAALGQRLAFGDIVLDAEQHKVFRGDTMLRLGPTEFACLPPSWKSRAGCGAASNCSTGCGAATSMSMRAPSTFISAG